MKSSYKIRQATSCDIETLIDLWSELVELHAQLEPNWVPAPDGAEHFASFLAGQLDRDDVLILVAELDGHAVGYCQAAIGSRPPIFAHRERCLILDLLVSDKQRHQGLGARFLIEVEAWARCRGVRRVEVGVACANDAAISFYNKRGFVAYSQRMVKEISEP